MTWIPYPGEYEKKFYAIRTKDGREFQSAYPNAGIFHCFDEHDKIIEVPEKDVFEFKDGQYPWGD